jgi:autophagy-related protein 2
MVLRHTIIYGVSGAEKLGKTLNDIWMPDIKRNQLPGILAGLAPVRSIVNVGGGLRHLVLVPMREYQKDGRIVRSLSKGAAAFAKTTGTELVKLGAKVAIGVQTVLQGAEDLLSQPAEASGVGIEDDSEDEETKQISLYANQPVGVLQGLRGGYDGLQRDLLLARDAIIAVPGEVMDGGNAAGVLRAVRKHAPTVILRPAIGVAKAGGQVLMGATNALDPANIRRAEAVSRTPWNSSRTELILTSRNTRGINELTESYQ